MYSFMYDKVNRDNKAKKDTKFTMIITIIIVIALVIIASFAWSFGFRYRFSHFLEKFAECNSYSEKEDSLTAEMDGKIYKVTEDNRQGIFNYIVLNNSGKESKKFPEERPIVLDYGNGAVIKLWKVSPDKYTNSSGLFIHYEDTDGYSYSYINYKMTLETIITRYLLYDNIDLTEDKTDTVEILVSEDDAKENEAENEEEGELKNETEDKEKDDVNIVDEEITIQDMDWDEYQNIMNSEEYEVLLEYLPVLKNEVKFIWDVDFYFNDESERKVVTIDEFRYILDNEIWDAGYDPDELWVNSIAICDMDGDGIKELILLLDNIVGHFLILHKENEEFYGTNRVYRAFEALQTNGTYIASGGAYYNYYYKMKFIDGKFEEDLLGYTDWDSEKQEALYYLGEEMTKDHDVYEEWLESIMPEDVVYYDAVRKE